MLRQMNINAMDPDIRRFVSEMRNEWKNYPPVSAMSLPDLRAAAEAVRAPWRKGGPKMAETKDIVFDPGAGELAVRIYHPKQSETGQPALVYLHGGGFTLFSINTHDRLMREYASLGGFSVIGVDYPLAPEAKYPEALNRIEALMLWLKENASQWRIDPDRIAMGGDSAGGNLSFATFMRLRDRGEHVLVKAILSNYGGFSAHISEQSEARYGGPGSIMDRAEALQYWANYLRDENDAADPYACPLLADLAGFPPVLLVVAELDIVAEHSLAMQARLDEANVPTECVVYRGSTHSFVEAMSISQLARDAIADGADFISRHLHPEESSAS